MGWRRALSRRKAIHGTLVQVTISSSGATVATLGPAATDSTGHFEVVWQTQQPDRKGAGGTATGAYSATVTDITLDGYAWDEGSGSVSFTLQ